MIKRNLKKIASKIGVLNKYRSIQKKIEYRRLNLIHIINEYFYRLSDPKYKISNKDNQRYSLLNKSNISELKLNGITKIENLFTKEEIGRLSKIASKVFLEIESGLVGKEKNSPNGYLPSTPYLEHGVDKVADTVFAHNPFIWDEIFIKISLHPQILRLAQEYIGRKFYLQQSILSRYYPKKPGEFGSFQWHHDAWGKKLNVMFLFTDVGEEDQFMTYIKGSHQRFYNLERCRNSRFTEDEIDRLFTGFERMKCIGKAGTIFLFDSNGMHRGNRSLSRYRDSLITSFNAGRYIWEFDLPIALKDSLDLNLRKFLKRSAKIKWV